MCLYRAVSVKSFYLSHSVDSAHVNATCTSLVLSTNVSEHSGTVSPAAWALCFHIRPAESNLQEYF